jgi:glycopeptide antibiotics resistance protein
LSFYEQHKSSLFAKLPQFICASVLLSILVAGLWPFHAPLNEVTWSDQGLRFGKHGSIASSEIFEVVRPERNDGCSLEIWLQPRRPQAAGTILAFFLPASNVVPFALRQSLGDLLLQRTDYEQSAKTARIYLESAFSDSNPVFFAISSGPAGTAIYKDGILVKTAPSFKLSVANLTGQLILGNMPSTSDNWVGQVNGLVIRDRELSANEVKKNFADWTKNKQTGAERTSDIVASYRFSEGKSNTVNNQLNSRTDLLIPKRYFVLRKQFFKFPWEEYRANRAYWKDVGVNVVGFMPLGFFLSSYFASAQKIKRIAMVTIALGFFVSVTIEFIQAFLPTRDSDITDIMTNTLGTVFGVTLYFHVRSWQRQLNCTWPPFLRR